MAKIIIAGDFCPQARVAELFEKGVYDSVLCEVKQLISQVDYSIVNLECPIVSNSCHPIIKRGPNLQCSDTIMGAIKFAGFNCVTLANNHFRDFGDQACCETLNVLDEGNIAHVGGGKTLQDAVKTLYVEIEDITVAIVNICEHEFSIASDLHPGSAPLDFVDNYHQITTARIKADFVLVVIHGGTEMYQLPTPRMRKTYRWFVDIGADAVINHHQHCFSGQEIYKGKPIFYGLGNFCFDRPFFNNPIWNEGYLVNLSIKKNEAVSYTILPYKQCEKGGPTIRFLHNEELASFNEKFEQLSKIIENASSLEKSYDEYVAKCSKTYLLETEPYNYASKLNSLRIRKLFPNMHNDRSLLNLFSIINCESHFDILRKAIAEKIGVNNE